MTSKFNGLGFDYNQHVEDVNLFNDIGNPLTPETNVGKALLAQAKVVLEEAKELYDAAEAFANGDKSEEVMLELVDGFVDVSVTNIGIGRILKHMDYDLKYAVEAVGANNLAKFPSTEAAVWMSIAKIRRDSLEDGLFPVFNEHYRLYVIKDTNGKIRKPYYFQSVDLTPALPKKKENT